MRSGTVNIDSTDAHALAELLACTAVWILGYRLNIATMADSRLHVLVAGAGLGGLTAALALAQKGIKVCICITVSALLQQTHSFVLGDGD